MDFTKLATCENRGINRLKREIQSTESPISGLEPQNFSRLDHTLAILLEINNKSVDLTPDQSTERTRNSAIPLQSPLNP